MTQLMTTKDLGAYLQLGRTSIYALIASEGFPTSYDLRSRAKRWPSAEIDLWLEGQRSEKEEVLVVPTGMVTSNGFTIRAL
jgi:predicted DNA-binding transcriptional regulator AlpA